MVLVVQEHHNRTRKRMQNKISERSIEEIEIKEFEKIVSSVLKKD